MTRTHSFHSHLPLVLVAALANIIAVEAGAQCARLSPFFAGGPWRGSSVAVVSGTGVAREELRSAAAIWQRSCSAQFSSHRLPTLVVDGPADRTVVVERLPGTSPHAGRCGYFHGNYIRLWDWTRTAAGLMRCTPTDAIIAHEIGHVLYLGDIPMWAECNGFIMAQLNPFSSNAPTVSSAECQMAALANRPGFGEAPSTVVVASDQRDSDPTNAATTVAQATQPDSLGSKQQTAETTTPVAPEGAAPVTPSPDASAVPERLTKEHQPPPA